MDPPSRTASVAAACVAAMLVAWAPEADADCPRATLDWVNRCASAEHLDVRDTRCVGPLTTVDLTTTAGPLRLEVSPFPEKSFRRAGSFGISPIGEFADWGTEPWPLRDALDRVARCATGGPLERRAPPRVGWLWPLAAALGVGACWAARRRRSLSTHDLGTFALLAVVAVAVGAIRWLVVPVAFLHQNGQGPLWVAAALGQLHASMGYGTGYAELLHPFSVLWPGAPESGVFLAQAVLGAASVPCAWLIARSASGSRALGWSATLVVAMDPVLARLAQSESYFGVETSLGFAAAALLSLGASLRDRKLAAGAFVLSAALLVAQAVRVHPVGWPSAALLPLVVVVRPGRRGSVLTFAALAALAIAVVVFVTSSAVMGDVLHGAIGETWLPVEGQRLRGAIPLGGVTLGLGAALSTRRRRVLRALGAAVLTSAGCWATALLNEHAPWILHATVRLVAPVLLACASSLLTAIPWARRRRTAVATIAALCGVAASLPSWRSVRTLPTDAQEAEWARTWRHDIPVESPLVYLERAGQRVVVLPVYSIPRVIALSSEEGEGAALRGVHDVVYYRSSACSTPEGRPLCARVEAELALTPIAERSFPAIPSMVGLNYDVPEVRVGLFRGRRRE